MTIAELFLTLRYLDLETQYWEQMFFLSARPSRNLGVEDR